MDLQVLDACHFSLIAQDESAAVSAFGKLGAVSVNDQDEAESRIGVRSAKTIIWRFGGSLMVCHGWRRRGGSAA
jgi:hypothetical protein